MSSSRKSSTTTASPSRRSKSDGRHAPFEEFVDDDVKPKNGVKTSYDLLAETYGCSASDLKKWAQIHRLKSNCVVYKNIVDYVQNSGASGTKVKQVYKVARTDERDPFDEPYRIMLWHGTKSNCVQGIIQSGFKRGAGGLYGGGIYLADRLHKSQGYAGANSKGHQIFVLAEVAPGRVYKAHHTHSNYSAPPQGFDSVKGNGSNIPNWKQNKSYFGAILPCGATTLNTRHAQFDLAYNEYILYDSNRVIVRFIVECGV